jgi:hypothetical protein
MSENSKPVVRLDRGQTSKPAAKKSEPNAEQPIKLAVRLNEGVNDALRNLIRYRGDLSKMAYEALTTIDLTTVDLVSVDEPMVADTTISMPRTLHKKLKKIADDRDSSMNIVVNSGLAHWLAKKGLLRLA